MRTIQLTLDDELAETLDQIVKMLKTTRATFIREVLKAAIAQEHISMLESKHIKGYGLKPVSKAEFRIWETEQEWGEVR